KLITQFKRTVEQSPRSQSQATGTDERFRILEDDGKLEVTARLLRSPAHEEFKLLSRVRLNVVRAVVEAPEAFIGARCHEGFGVIEREVTQEQSLRLELHEGKPIFRQVAIKISP